MKMRLKKIRRRNISEIDLEKAFVAGFAKSCQLRGENMYDGHWTWAKDGFREWFNTLSNLKDEVLLS